MSLFHWVTRGMTMQFSEKVQILKKSPIFSILNESEQLELSKIAFERALKSGEFLFQEEERCEYFYVLVEGKIRASLYSSLGKDLTLITYLRPGEILGPTSIFRDRPPSGSMQAVVPTQVLGFNKNEFVSFILGHPLIMLEMLKVLAARVSELNRRLRDVAGERVEQRLFRVMLTLSRRLGPTFTITRQELADMVGATTETIIRILSSLQKEKIIASVRGKVTILDEARLRVLSEGLS
ncbi:MAG: Crp/Fnr family transcriptional regulator [Deltaproteobacteria bacterium]|nr:Crp/Fnr family transcriptional regulator [Deltaproteobacteria bacterium]